MKLIATLQLLSLLSLVGCSSGRRFVVPTAPAKYDSEQITKSVTATRKHIETISDHATKAETHGQIAKKVADTIQEQGTAAHSEEAKIMVDSMNATLDELGALKLEVQSARTTTGILEGQVAEERENSKIIYDQLKETNLKFSESLRQADADHANALKYKDYAKKEAILITVLLIAMGGYAFLKFYMHVPFL